MAGNSLSRHAISYMAAQLSANAVGFVTAMALARAFSKQEMGDYQQLMVVYALFSGVLIAGLPTCLTYFYPIADESRKPATVYIVLILLFAMGAALGVATFAGAPLIGMYFKNVRLAELVRDFFLFYAFTLGGAYMRRLLVATSRYRFLMFWLPFDRLLMLLSFAVPALAGMGLQVAVRVAVWVAGFKFVLTTLYTTSIVPPSRFLWDKELVVKMLYYSIPLGLSQAVGKISRQIDLLVIGRYMNAEFFATFTWAASALPFISEIPESVTTVLTPELAKLHSDGDNATFISIWQESIRKTAIIVLGLFALMEAFAHPIIVAMYSQKYEDSVFYFRLYQIGLIARVTMFGAILQAIGRTDLILYGSLALLAVKAPLNVILFKLAGPSGPIIGSLFLGLAIMICFLNFISRRLRTTVWKVWPWSYHGKILAAAAVAGLASMAVYLIPRGLILGVMRVLPPILAQSASLEAFLQFVMGAGVFVPLYVLLLQTFGALKGKDWQLLKDMTYGRFLGR